MSSCIMMCKTDPVHRIVVERVARTKAHRFFIVSDRCVGLAIPNPKISSQIVCARVVGVRLNGSLHHFNPGIELQPDPVKIEAYVA